MILASDLDQGNKALDAYVIGNMVTLSRQNHSLSH